MPLWFVIGLYFFFGMSPQSLAGDLRSPGLEPRLVLQQPPNKLNPPLIPIGVDAFRMWDRWHHLRIGARAYMRSTYDRAGGNHHADASHFLYQLADDRNVTLDIQGPAILAFVRHNHWHGSPWRYVVDGAEYVVEESSTSTPHNPVPNSVFLPLAAFPSPLTWTWSQTMGADLSWVPIPIERSFQMEYSRTHYGTGYYIFHQFVPGANLSSPIRSWDASPPPAEVLELIGRSGTDIAPTQDSLAGKRLGLEELSGTLALEGKPRDIAFLSGAQRLLRAFKISIPRERALDLAKVRLKVTWDGRSQPSIDVPVPLFFGTGSLYNHDNREFLVKAFPVTVRFDSERIELAAYFPMPFFHSARFELVPEAGLIIPDLRWSVRTQPLDAPTNHVGYFHATYRDFPNPERGKDLVLLDTTVVEGGGDWAGHLVGTSFIFSHQANLTTLEGDPRFFFDDSRTPQAQGTGTEEWAGGGDYWGGQTVTLPFAGHPVGGPQGSPRSEADKIESAYRFLLADLMPFGRNARVQLEHGGLNESVEHYQTATFWYGLPSASLVKTDEVDIGNAESEQGHAYSSPQASQKVELTSRFELGPDSLDGVEIYPAHTEDGRTTTGTSEFTLRIDPDNVGVLLRRTLDYGFPNQRASIAVADASEPDQLWDDIDFKSAGIWYLAGSNLSVFSDPPDELGAAEHVVMVSNRRFREDEFLLPKAFTEGRSAIRIRITFDPVMQPLFPGYPVPELAWSELDYAAYSFIVPKL